MEVAPAILTDEPILLNLLIDYRAKRDGIAVPTVDTLIELVLKWTAAGLWDARHYEHTQYWEAKRSYHVWATAERNGLKTTINGDGNAVPQLIDESIILMKTWQSFCQHSQDDLSAIYCGLEQHFPSLLIEFPLDANRPIDPENPPDSKAMADSMERLRRLIVAERAKQEETATKAEPTTERGTSNGPVDPSSFCWNGDVYPRFTGKAFLLVKALWNNPARRLPFSSLAEMVWGDHAIPVGESEFGTPRKTANKFFSDHGIPLIVKSKKETGGEKVAYLHDCPRG